MVFLASVILVSCTKDEIITYPEPSGNTNPIAPKPTPFGTVNAPFVAVSLLQSSGEFKIEKYRADGSFRAGILDGYFSGTHIIYNPDFSGLGDKFCYAENETIYILNVNTLERQQVVGNVGEIESTQLSPDGTTVAYFAWNADNTLGLNVVGISAETAPVRLAGFQPGNSALGPPSFSPDGNKITYSEYPNIVVSDLDGNNKIRITEGSIQKATYPVFNNDGTRLFYFLDLDQGMTIASSEVREGAGEDQMLLTVLNNHSITNPSHLIVSKDGAAIYFIGTSSGHTNLFRLPVSGGVPQRVAFDITNSGEYMVSGLDFIGRIIE